MSAGAKMCKVCIAWGSSSPGTVFFLAYDGGAGAIRVYWRDAYDARLDIGRDRSVDGPLPFFESGARALTWIAAHPNEQCQVTLAAAREMATGLDFAEVA